MVNPRLHRSTKGKTWEEIYGYEYAARKRAATIAKMSGRHLSPKTKALLSSKAKEAYRNGRVNHQTGKPHTESTKAKISATRRARHGTRASLNKRIRYTAQYRRWRTAIFQRDAYTCQDCGINTAIARKRVVLHVHHIEPLFALLEGLTFEQGMRDARVWDNENAVTLCAACHAKIPVPPYWRTA